MSELSDLFDMDPLALARDPEARKRLIAEMRANRERFVAGIKTPREKRPAKPVPAGGLSLEDLGL